MKIVFFGTPDFSSQILKKILNGNEIVSIVTAEDSQKGRGKKFQFPDVKKTGIELNIPVFQPKNLKDDKFVEKLKKFNADIFLVIAFRKLPKKVWQIPKKGTINLHTSFLPDYRGAGPINWVLINGEKHTGISSFFINDKIDQGDIILQKKISIDKNMTAAQLHNQMISDSIEITNKTIELIKNNTVKIKIQNQTETHNKAPKINKEL